MKIIRGFEDLINDEHARGYRKYPIGEFPSMKITAASPSPLLKWYIQENTKRRAKYENEIDLAEIKAALKGVFNKWHPKLKEHKEILTKYAEENKSIKWDDIIKL